MNGPGRPRAVARADHRCRAYTEARGHSFSELLLVASVAAVLASAALGFAHQGLEGMRTRGAARYLASRLRDARARAVVSQSNVGVHFSTVGSHYTLTLVADGNGNGLRTSDIRSGTDPMLSAPETLGERFSGVEFGIAPGIPGLDDDSLSSGSDPIRLGRSDVLSWSPLGTATAGTLYLRDGAGHQSAVRISGSGRCQAWEYRRSGWQPL